jgi:hypothetical protein
MTIGAGIFSSTVLLIVVFALWQTTKHHKWKAVGKAFAAIVALGTAVGVTIWGWNEYSERPVPQNALAGIALGMSPLDVQIQKGKPSEAIPAMDETPAEWMDDPIVEPTRGTAPAMEKPKPITFDEVAQASSKPWKKYQAPANGGANPFDQFDEPRKSRFVPDSPQHGAPPTGPAAVTGSDMRWLFDDGDYTDAFTLVVFDETDAAMRVSIVCRHNGYETLFGLSRGRSDHDVVEKLGNPTTVSIRADGAAKLISYEHWNAAFEVEKGEVTALCVANRAVRFAQEFGEPVGG